MMIIPDKFQPSRSTGMGGKRGDRHTQDVTPFSHDPYTKKLNHNENSELPPSLRSGGITRSAFLSIKNR